MPVTSDECAKKKIAEGKSESQMISDFQSTMELTQAIHKRPGNPVNASFYPSENTDFNFEDLYDMGSGFSRIN